MLSPLAGRGGAGFDQGSDVLGLGLDCSCLVALSLQGLLQPLLSRAAQHPIGQLLHQGLSGLLDGLKGFKGKLTRACRQWSQKPI